MLRDFVPGLNEVFQLAWCQVDYSASPNGTLPPTIFAGTCQVPADWQDLVEDPTGGEHYSASVQFKRKDFDLDDVFRLYVVLKGPNLVMAHRDVVIDPNLTTPADGYVHAIGFGNEPIKVRITDGFGCVRFDTQGNTAENAATCLISDDTPFKLVTNELTTEFTFHETETFLANFEVSECQSLVDEDGNALVDTPLAACKIFLSSNLLDLSEPGQIFITAADGRWDVAGRPFEIARLNILQEDEFGVAVLPPSAPGPGWFGAVMAMSDIAPLRWIGKGLGRLAALFGVKPLYAPPGAGWDFTRMSDFQIAVMPVMFHDPTGIDCAVVEPHCYNLGTSIGTQPVSVTVKVRAPDRLGRHTFPTDHFPVPDTRLHFFPDNASTVACPGPNPNPIGPFGRGCYAPDGTGLATDLSTSPASEWDHLVVVTGLDGIGSVKWTLDPNVSDNTLNVSACGVARPGGKEPNPGDEVADGVWGTLGDCSDRFAAIANTSAFDNGPADGFTPFEPVDTENEVAIYGLPLTFEAKICPQIEVDGIKGAAEWECAGEPTGFIAPLKGKKVTQDNAWLYTYDDGETLYMALEVETNDLGNKIFINIVESFDAVDGVAAAGDELLILDFGDLMAHPLGEASDWHFTAQCVGNNSSSLCGDPDLGVDIVGLDDFNAEAAATVNGASGHVFYEFSRPLGSPGATAFPKEDLNATSGQQLGLRVRVTQGKGGGKGGFVFPDPQTSTLVYHQFIMQ